MLACGPEDCPTRRAGEHRGEGRAATAAKSRSDRAQSSTGLSISHPDKILDESSHLTKLQLVEYYDAVADHLLPHIANRPLSIVRCPEGSGKPCFFQKQIGKGMPAGVDSVPVTVKKGGNPQREEYVTVSTREGLVGLGQMGVMELHPWGSSNEHSGEGRIGSLSTSILIRSCRGNALSRARWRFAT